MNPAIKTATAVSVALFSIMLLVSPGCASKTAASEITSNIIGTRTSWSIDSDWSGEFDGLIVMEDFSEGSGGTSGIGLSCLMTVKNDTDESQYSIENAEPVFANVSFVIENIASDEEIYYQLQVGVVRKAIGRSGVLNGFVVTIYYDAEVGLLLQANRTAPSGEDIIGIRMYETNAFPGYTTGLPYVAFFAVAFSVLSVVFIVTVTINDKKKRSKEACFSDECWS